MDVHAGGGDDDVALAAEEAELAGPSSVGEIAGGEPLALAGVHATGAPGGGGEHGAADEDLASSPMRTSRPGSGLPMVPRPMRKGWLRVTSAAVSVMP